MNKKQIEQEELLLKKLPEHLAAGYLADSFASMLCFALKDKRKELRMSQQEVANKSGLCRAGVSRFENFLHSPNLTIVGKYMYALGYTIEDVYKIALFIKNLTEEEQ